MFISPQGFNLQFLHLPPGGILGHDGTGQSARFFTPQVWINERTRNPGNYAHCIKINK